MREIGSEIVKLSIISVWSIGSVGCAYVPALDDADDETVAATEQACSGPRESSRLYVPPPNAGAIEQYLDLLRAHKFRDAARLALMESTPQAVWFTGGTPSEVRKSVKTTVKRAARSRSVPVLVAYNVPFRDCAGYSGGGALNTADYQAWIDGFAAGIGERKAIVVLEPDGVGIIPYYQPIFGDMEWCQPTIVDDDGNTVAAPGASPDERFAQLNYAVDTLAAKAPNALVYLDGTHSAWLGTPEVADRLIKAGVKRARGFYLNVSNYQLTSDSVTYGTWISQIITASESAPDWAYDENGRFHFDWVPSQYDPDTDFTEVNYAPEFVASVTEQVEGYLNGAVASTHFIIDTSRNGQGPLDTAPYALEPYNQPSSVIDGLDAGNWCNPRGAGLGLRPTLKTGVELLDAYLWVKIPGESDGSCDIAGGARSWDYAAYNPWGLEPDASLKFDPLWEMVDPSAGTWFPEQALELAKKANPVLF